MTNTPVLQLLQADVQMMAADPPINKTAPSLPKVRVAVNKLDGGKAAEGCIIRAAMLKQGEGQSHDPHVAYNAVCCLPICRHSS